MHIHVYHDPLKIYISIYHIPDKLINIIELSNNIYHITKNQYWKKNLFEDGLAVDILQDLLRIHIVIVRPLQPTTEHIGRIKEIRWNNFVYNYEEDHGKYAISDKEIYCLWIGDINAMYTVSGNAEVVEL